MHVPNTGGPGYPLPQDIPEFDPDYWGTELTDTTELYNNGVEGVAVGVARAGRIPVTHALSTADTAASQWSPRSFVMTVAVTTLSVQVVAADPRRRDFTIRCSGTGATDAIWVSSIPIGEQPSLTSPFPAAFRLTVGDMFSLEYMGPVYVIPDSGNSAAVVVSVSVLTD